MDGDDRILVDDTAVTVVIEMGRGDDSIVIGTVPQIPDAGNKNLEFPDGVPVAGAAGDQQAALFGQCAFAPGEASTSARGASSILPEVTVTIRSSSTPSWR